MSSFAAETHPQAQNIKYTDTTMAVELIDGRTITVPLVWYPRLSQATIDQLGNWELLGDGEGIHWPDLDEDLSIACLLEGRH